MEVKPGTIWRRVITGGAGGVVGLVVAAGVGVVFGGGVAVGVPVDFGVGAALDVDCVFARQAHAALELEVEKLGAQSRRAREDGFGRNRVFSQEIVRYLDGELGQVEVDEGADGAVNLKFEFGMNGGKFDADRRARAGGESGPGRRDIEHAARVVRCVVVDARAHRR